jgi:Flp pilus assembly CpaE family ATPase
MGRIDRLGQTRPVTIHVPDSLGTGPETHFDLVTKKVSASLQVEGLDVRAVLGAESGVSAAVVAQSLGEAMYRALVG